jgi:hypothetical protein
MVVRGSLVAVKQKSERRNPQTGPFITVEAAQETQTVIFDGTPLV